MMRKRWINQFRLSAERLPLWFADEGFNAEMQFDMDPDEPDYIDKDGETVENKANRMKKMNREEFKDHIGGVFEKHLAWRAKHARASANIENLLPEYESLLQEITEDVFNNPDYQRGVADYNKVYTEAWDMYLDAVDERGNASNPMYNHINKLPKAPGIYSKGELVQIPEMYKGRRRAARTEYAKQWQRAKAGMETDPERAFARKKAEDIRTGYGAAWRDVSFTRLLKENGVPPSEEELEAEVEKLVQNRLGSQLTKAYLRKDLAPPPYTPVKEVERRGRSIEGNIDVRDRTKVGRLINAEYKTEAKSEKQMNKLYTFTEKKRGNPENGEPRIVEVSKPGTKVRNKYVEGKGPEKGALVIDTDLENPNDSVIRLIDYRKADAMIKTLHDDPSNIYYPSLITAAGVLTKPMRELLSSTAVGGRKSDYYTSEAMMTLYTHTFPTLEGITGHLKQLGITPAYFAKPDDWDKDKGPLIAENITNANFLLWQNVILTYCAGVPTPTANTVKDRSKQLFTQLGIIPDPDAVPDLDDVDDTDGVSEEIVKLIDSGKVADLRKIQKLNKAEAEYFVNKISNIEGFNPKSISADALAVLLLDKKFDYLIWSNITALDEETAIVFAEKGAYLESVNLSGLKPLDPNVMQHLFTLTNTHFTFGTFEGLDPKKPYTGKVVTFAGEEFSQKSADGMAKYEGEILMNTLAKSIDADMATLSPKSSISISEYLPEVFTDKFISYTGGLKLSSRGLSSGQLVSITKLQASSLYLNLTEDKNIQPILIALSEYATRQGDNNVTLEVNVSIAADLSSYIGKNIIFNDIKIGKSLGSLKGYTGNLQLGKSGSYAKTEVVTLLDLMESGNYSKITLVKGIEDGVTEFVTGFNALDAATKAKITLPASIERKITR